MSGGVYAVYGIAAHLTDPTRSSGAQDRLYRQRHWDLHQPQHRCGLFRLLRGRLPDAAVRSNPPPSAAGPIAWRKLPNRLLSNTPRDVIVVFAMLFVCLAAMFMTGSRAGVLLSLMALYRFFASISATISPAAAALSPRSSAAAPWPWFCCNSWAAR